MQYDLTKVKSIYLGKDNACRCGCKGTYVERGENGFDRRMKKFIKLWCDYVPQKGDIDPCYLNVSYGSDRAMTVYFD